MDSKRKAAIAASDANDRTPKRVKSEPSSNPLITHGETAETTTEYGMKLLSVVKEAKDKNKRLVATNFMTLPDKNQAPGYYDVIKLPVALDTIETKLNRREFPNLSTLEGFFKRMTTNAKQYNIPSSEIYQDAERLRKVLGIFMKEHNPAYKLDKNYQSKATPVPGQLDGEEHDSDLDAEGEPDIEEPIGQPIADPVVQPPPVVVAPRGRGRPRGSLNKTHSQRASTTPVSESRFTGKGYAGLSFQNAQEKILYDLKAEPDKDGDPKFEVFHNLPPKTLRDYYKVIPNPMSLNSAIRHVKAGGSGTPYTSWKLYEDEVSLIWKNAFHYNEDGSEISNLARDLQTSFYSRLAEARQDVAEPSQGPKIKLRLGPEQSTAGPQKITLRMPGHGSPAVSPAPPSWNEAGLANTNGIPMNGMQQRQPFAASQSSTPVPYMGTPNRAGSLSASVASPGYPPVMPFRNEEVARPSSSLSSANLPQLQNGHSHSFQATPHMGNLMPPPRTPALSNSFSQSTNAYGHNVPHSGYNQDTLHSKWRLPGKDDSDALITKVTIATHPDLNIPRHFKMDVLPSPEMSQQSVTINLPSTHYYIQVSPIVARHVVNRQHKLFLTVNGQRLQSMPKIQGGVMDRESQVFVARLIPGVNRIELEIIAALPKGAVKGVNGSDVELEKFNIFANLLK